MSKNGINVKCSWAQIPAFPRLGYKILLRSLISEPVFSIIFSCVFSPLIMGKYKTSQQESCNLALVSIGYKWKPVMINILIIPFYF